MRTEIPFFSEWMRSHPDDDGPIDSDIVEVREEITRECFRRKAKYTKWIRDGVLSDNPVASFSFGPINLPADPSLFTSSRWSERRNHVPLPHDDETWRFIHRFWKRSHSYQGIKAHIEKYGMRRPLLADLFVNYDPLGGKLIHRAFAWRGENPSWPLMILRTGNERIMMAMYEWGWETVPVVLLVRDCGFDSAMSALLRLLHERSGLGGLTREIDRKVEDKGSLDLGLEVIIEGKLT